MPAPPGPKMSPRTELPLLPVRNHIDANPTDPSEVPKSQRRFHSAPAVTSSCVGVSQASMVIEVKLLIKLSGRSTYCPVVSPDAIGGGLASTACPPEMVAFTSDPFFPLTESE